MRRRTKAVLSVLVAVGLLSSATPSLATAVPEPESSDAPRIVDGTHPAPVGENTSFGSTDEQLTLQAAEAPGRVRAIFRVSVPGVPTTISPNDGLHVGFNRLDESSGRYMSVDVGAWTSEDGKWTSADLAPGTYSVSFFPEDDAIGQQFWKGARYWAEAVDLVVTSGETVSLGTITLRPWTVDVWRDAGADRYATAVAASQAREAAVGRPTVVYLADGMNYPDALAAGPAAIERDGVLLLTEARRLPEATRAELIRLAPEEIVIVGGTGAVSKAVANAVRSAVPSARVVRQSGANRFETGEAIVRSAFAPAEANTLFVATGNDYPDALAAGAVAGAYGAPVVLVDGSLRKLASTSRALISWLDAREVVIVGGRGAVSAGIEGDLKSLFGAENVYRVSGADRYTTAAALNSAAFGPVETIYLATGTGFADALAGVPLAGAVGAPVQLTEPRCLVQPAIEVMSLLRPNGIGLLGGPGALSQAVADIRRCR